MNRSFQLSNYPSKGNYWPAWMLDDHNDEIRIDCNDNKSIYLCRDDLVRMIEVIDKPEAEWGIM